MIRIKALFANEEEKEKLISTLRTSYGIKKVSKEYKKEGPYIRIHLDLINK